MATTALAKAPDQIISAGGGVSILRAALVTSKASVFVFGGYASAEMGSSLLRAGFDQVEAFAAKGFWQQALVKVAPSMVATMFIALMTYRGGQRMGRSRTESAGAAAKVAILMMLGMGISVVKKPLSDITVDMQGRVTALITGIKATKVLPNGASSEVARAAGSNLPDNVVDMGRRRAGADDVPFYAGSNPPGSFGGPGTETLPRAGGDAGFGPAPGPPNASRIMRTETW
jgi:hypothetical protein